MWKSAKRYRIHVISLVVDVNALYSASAELLEMVGCFLVRHEIRESPRNRQKPITYLLEIGQVAQSESENPLRSKLELDE